MGNNLENMKIQWPSRGYIISKAQHYLTLRLLSQNAWTQKHTAVCGCFLAMPAERM